MSARNIGRYVLYDRIASGGMAQVHLGRLVGAVGFSRTVAIKRLLPHCATDAEIVPMFVDEARLAARIRHPNVVGTLDVVQEGDELLLVMEYVHGESLARLVGRARSRGALVPPSIVIAIGISMLEGLHAAHEARSERGEPLGIVHRDVSPQNVIIGADGVARVVDFGIAKARGRIQTTRDGQLKGKAGYVAPEQLRADEIDRRVDVYAASVVLWEALAGQRLFQGDGAPQVMRNVLEQRVELPSRFASGIPKRLDEIVMRGLARNPDGRFATAREMAIALERVLAPATPREIEQWVHSLAADVLEERAALVQAIENDSAQAFAFAGADERVYAATSLALSRGNEDPTERDERQPPPSRSPPSSRRMRVKASDDALTTPLSATPSGVVDVSRSSQSSTTSRGPWIVAGAVVVAGVLAFVLVTRGGTSSTTTSPPEPSPTTMPVPVAAVASSSPTPPIPEPVATPAPTTATTPTPKHLAHPPPSRLPKAPNVPATPNPNCAVPFTRGPDGTKIPKPECF